MIQIRWEGPQWYYAVSPDKQANIDLGYCGTEEELRQAAKECEEQDGNYEGWITAI